MKRFTNEIFIDIDRMKLGLYALEDSTKAPIGSARIMSNMQITDRGGVSPRPGTKLLGAANTGSMVKGMFNFKKSFSQNEIIMRGNGTKLEIYSKQHTAAGWFTLKDGFTANKEFGFAPSLVNTDMQDYVVFSNRYEPYMRWDGAIMLITAPVTGGATSITVDSTMLPEVFQSKTATANTATTFTVSGTPWTTDQWKGFYVYVPSSGAVRKITGNTSSVLTYDTLGGAPGNVAFEIRRSIFNSATGTMIYNGTEIAYTGFPTITSISVASAHAAPANTGLASVPTEYPNAPRGNRLANLLTRIVVGNVRSAVARDSGGAYQGYASAGSYFVSKLKDPTDFGYSATRVAGEGDIVSTPYGGGDITDVQTQEDAVYVFKEDYIEAAKYSQDANDFAQRTPLKSGVGSVGKTIRGSDDVYFMTKDRKFVSLGRVKTVDVLPQTDNLGYQIKRLLDTYNPTDICGIEHKDKIYISLKSNDVAIANNITLVYNKQLKAFEGIWNIGANAFVEWGDLDAMYFGDSTSGNVYEGLTGTADIVGSARYPISSEYESHFMNLAPKGLTSVQQSVNGLYFEGYIREGTEVTFNLFKDFSTDAAISFTFKFPTHNSTLDGTIVGAFMGGVPLGLFPMGTVSADPDADGRRHFSFRVYFPFQWGQYFSVGWNSYGADLDYEIIRYGMMVSQGVSWDPGKVITI